MTAGIVPDWNAQGIIPPISAITPTSGTRSPYAVSLCLFVDRFGTTESRSELLKGFLAFRRRLHEAGCRTGFQWVDGSFLEDIETVEDRSPADIDVVTFFHLPSGQSQGSFAAANRDIFDKSRTKEQFNVDAYFVPLDDIPPVILVERSVYWYSLWSHRRNGQWKGYLQIDLAPTDEDRATTVLEAPTGEGDEQ